MSEENFLDLLGMNESTMDEAASYMLIHSCIDNILILILISLIVLLKLYRIVLIVFWRK